MKILLILLCVFVSSFAYRAEGTDRYWPGSLSAALGYSSERDEKGFTISDDAPAAGAPYACNSLVPSPSCDSDSDMAIGDCKAAAFDLFGPEISPQRGLEALIRHTDADLLKNFYRSYRVANVAFGRIQVSMKYDTYRISTDPTYRDATRTEIHKDGLPTLERALACVIRTGTYDDVRDVNDCRKYLSYFNLYYQYWLKLLNYYDEAHATK